MGRKSPSAFRLLHSACAAGACSPALLIERLPFNFDCWIKIRKPVTCFADMLLFDDSRSLSKASKLFLAGISLLHGLWQKQLKKVILGGVICRDRSPGAEGIRSKVQHVNCVVVRPILGIIVVRNVPMLL